MVKYEYIINYYSICQQWSAGVAYFYLVIMFFTSNEQYVFIIIFNLHLKINVTEEKWCPMALYYIIYSMFYSKRV